MIEIIDQAELNAGKEYWETVNIDKPYNELIKPAGLESYHSITAHPPLLFKMHLNEPVQILGYMNITTRPNPLNPIEVRIAEMIIGYLYLPGNRTHTVHLPKGEYEVSVNSSGNVDYQHVYLLFKQSNAYTQ
jgi:hypothetical protein